MADSLPSGPLSPSEYPAPLARAAHERDGRSPHEREFEVPAPPRDRIWLHALLFVLTFLTATEVGKDMYVGYLSDFGYRRPRLTQTAAYLGGLWYSVPALLILGSHEMGHYLACKYYRINASLPYFLPAPPGVVLFGTLGAVIRIRQPLTTKRVLFDVGIAGPIAGFVVLLPAIWYGLAWSRVVREPARLVGINLGEPMLFQYVSRWFFGAIPDGYALNAHPMAFAAIFGLLATALNLLPLGQLDGGHIAYASLGRRTKWLTYGTLAAMFVLGWTVAYSWLFWCLIMIMLLQMTGWQHPHTLDEDQPIGSARIVLSIVAILIFALCFTPAPIVPLTQ